MPLTMAPLNQEVNIVRILLEEKLKKHLESLGITINSKLTVLNESKGNLICIVKDGRLALDSTVARKIMISVN